jgi:hypothetical protein
MSVSFSKGHETCTSVCSTNVMSYPHTSPYTLWKASSMLTEKILREMKLLFEFGPIQNYLFVTKQGRPIFHSYGPRNSICKCSVLLVRVRWDETLHKLLCFSCLLS